MKCYVGHGKDQVEERLQSRGVNRRDFMKFCTAVAAAMGMGPAFAPKVAQALTAKKRPSVVYLHCAECTGCSESVLRAVDPYIDELLLDVISMDYHETLMAGAGHQVEEAMHEAIKGEFICVIEGGLPKGDGGYWGKVGGVNMYDLAAEVAPKAMATISIGNCANYGGVQAAAPNPTGTVGVNEGLAELGVKSINIAGCPPNPINFVGTVVHLLTKGMPELDDQGRPVMFFGESVHDNCPRLKHFEAGEFVTSFASEEAKKGYCLYEVGCKGPDTYNNCPTQLFNQVNWPVQAGHPCIACSEPQFWDLYTPFYEA